LFQPVETHLADHHELILEAMTRTTEREYGRLLMMLPPGSGKTSYASIVFPSHYLGKFPGSRLALGSYGSDLALKMGRKTRSMIRQPRYKAIFNTDLSRDSRAGNYFALTNGSEYMADSLGGQFPGNHSMARSQMIRSRDGSKRTLRRFGPTRGTNSKITS
jgi:hypothetical protein